MKTVFELYDSRYLTNPDRATVYSVCDTIKEAKREKREDWPDAVIVKCIMKPLGGNRYEQMSAEIVK